MKWEIDAILNKGKKNSDSIISDRKLNYDFSYVSIRKYVDSFNTLGLDEVLVLLNFTYGWMPRVARILNADDLPKLVNYLNNAKSDTSFSLEKESLNEVSKIINSVVGLSKMLHFVNPNKFAIWDSRVAFHFYQLTNEPKVEKINYRVHNFANSAENYITYNEAIIRFFIDPDSQFKNIREIEQALFNLNLSIQAEPSNETD